MKIEMNMPVLPEDWEYTGEYRQAFKGENVFNSSLPSEILMEKTGACYPIVRRVRKWRPAKIEDINKELKGQFFDDITDRGGPHASILVGWHNGLWISSSGHRWTNCRVLDN